MSQSTAAQFFADGWCRFNFDPVLAQWIEHSIGAARAGVRDPANEQWLRHDGTWFVGVNALPNDRHGAVPGGVALAGRAVEFVAQNLNFEGDQWDRAQVSVLYPGYPRASDDESPAAFNYRRNRDAAHVDGIRRIGPERRRFLAEPHAFVLGVPMVSTRADAAPFVVWRGSHEMVRRAFADALATIAPAQWATTDLTDVYNDLRREIFSRAERVTLLAQPGEAYLVHRLALHGMAPWSDDAQAGADGRMVCYFRPLLNDYQTWLTAP